MYALLTLDVARDAVADQFTYGEPLRRSSSRGARPARPAHPVAAARALHRVADLLAPADYSPAH